MSATIEGRGEELLKGKNFCHVATLRPDGSVHGVPVWVDVEDGRAVLNTAKGRAWPRNLERDPRVTLTVQNMENPYEYLDDPWPRRDTDDRRRRRTHRRDGEEVHGRRRVPDAPARRTAHHRPRRARARTRLGKLSRRRVAILRPTDRRSASTRAARHASCWAISDRRLARPATRLQACCVTGGFSSNDRHYARPINRRHNDGPRGWVRCHSSRNGSSPRARAASTHALWAWRRRRMSPAGAISMCSLSAGR